MGQEAKAKLAKLEEGMEQLAAQKKQFHAQLLQVQGALEALQDDAESYRLIGNLMVRAQTPELRKELSDRQETLQVRIASIEKQEEKLRGRIKDAQEEVLKEVK